MADWEETLQKRQSSGLLRTLPTYDFRESGYIISDGKRYLDLSSNDPFGLTENPACIDATAETLRRYGLGSSGSRLLTGNHPLHTKLEQLIATFKQSETALLFNSGYQANVGIISTFFSKQDIIFADKLCHASILDGISLSGATLYRFKHNDIDHLQTLLSHHRHEGKRSLIVTESLFSMDGDEAPLEALIALKKCYTSWLMVDEAHATGLCGPQGSGLATPYAQDIELIVGTFGKAFGAQGAYVATSFKLKEALVNLCRSFVYSTAMSPVISSWIMTALIYLQDHPELRQTLNTNAAYFREKLVQRQKLGTQRAHIYPFIVGHPDTALRLSSTLKTHGFWCSAIRPPTVPAASSRLRFALTIFCTPPLIDQLFEVLDQYV